MKKAFSILLAILMICAVFSGCGGGDTAPSTEGDTAPDTTPADSGTAATDDAAPGTAKDLSDCTIALSIHFKTDDYGVICSEGFEQACAAAGVNYEVLDANSDAQKQLSDIESFIAKKVDAIVVSPVDDQAVKDVINKATDQGIPVIVITLVPDANVATTIHAGNYDFSEEVAEKLCEKMNYEGKVALMDIPTTLWRTGQRLQAFQDVIGKYEDMEIVAIEKKMTPDEAKAAAENLLTAHPDLGGIFGTFSNVVYGPGAACRDMNRPEVVVGGVDADMSILELMRDGWIDAVAAQFPDSHGIMGAEAAIGILRGEDVPSEMNAVYKVFVQGEEEAAAEEVWGKTLD